MKNSILTKLFIILTLALFVFYACTEDVSDNRLNPKLATSQIQNLTSDSVVVTGFIIAKGDGFNEKGICYDLTENPTIDANKVVYEGDEDKATFSVMLRGLTRLTDYYARAYAIGPNGTVYGDNIEFTTPAALPTIAAISESDIANTTDNGITATTEINITDDGGDGEGPDVTANITSRGVVYSETPNPTISNSKTQEGTGAGTFTSLAKKLMGNTTYYLRAYATNGIGTTYSNEVTFDTPIGFPMCITISPKDITKTTATLLGKITYDGGGEITDQGLCYGLTENPTISDTKVSATPQNDTLKAEITGLDIYTKYYVRAYVVNETGVNYGENLSFTTLPDIVKFFVVGTNNGWTNNSTAPFIESTATNPEAQGYVYFSDPGSFKLTTDHSWDNDHTFGDDGSGGLTNPGGNITVSTAGYYLIKANLTNMTYSITLTTWGIIGDATPGSWDSQTNMNYNTTTKVFSLAANLTTGGAFKFRGTSDWNINYGSTAADGSTLDPGGSNIPVTVTADYAITLDLSAPNDYKYSANRWGAIGDFNSWGASQAMNWDAVNNVFKTTITTTTDNSSFKFRANDGWDVNLGGNLGALTPGGDNIIIATAGTYVITLDPWSKVATITASKKK